jgi:transposase
MNPREMALLSSVLHLPAGITIASVHPSATELVVCVSCHAPSMECPQCHQPSARIHGHYRRTVADLPCAGRNVILALTVRKFVCSTPVCPRKIFTERLPGLVQSYARMTPRLIALVQALGLVSGGQMGTRLVLPWDMVDNSRDLYNSPLADFFVSGHSGQASLSQG